jgi:hypothetical protein
MLNQKTVDKLNNFFENRTLKYVGPIIGGDGVPNSEIDFKIQFLGYKKMMSVGEYYDYLKVKVTLIKTYDSLSTFMFDKSDVNYPIGRDFWEKERYFLMMRLSSEIRSKLQAFDPDIRLIIEEFHIDLKNSEPITEGKMSRVAIRSLVKDLTRVLKKKKEGTFYLPDEDGGEYSFGDLPFNFSCEFEVIFDDTLKGYLINGSYSYDDDVVELVIKVNPNNVISQMYEIVGELNEVVAHELEHGRQYSQGEVNERKEIENSFDYYTQIHEIKAQKAGFKRLSKLRKVPVEKVAKNWFKTHKDVHGLNEEETRKVLSLILN